MSLEIQKTAGTEKMTESKALLASYMAGSLVEMSNLSKVQAEQVAAERAAEVDIKAFKLEDIKEAQASVKKDLKNYGIQEKMYYHADGEVVKKDEMEAFSRAGIVAMAGFAMGITGAIANSPEVAIAGMGGAAMFGVVKATMRYLGEPTNEAEAKKAEEFKTLKHTQLALKQLKKVVEAPVKAAKREAYKEEVAKYMAMSNPGGMVSPVTLAQKGKGR